MNLEKFGYRDVINALRFDSIRGMLTVPGLIGLAGLALALIILSIDGFEFISPYSFIGVNLQISPETARTLISTIAGASLTTLSLVYSITLLVFTFASGTIGPRLLQRFTSDRINQVTAGILGATFIYSVIVLHRIADDFVPVISISIIMLMAVVSVVLLVIFVHAVARRVTVDEEVALISEQLNDELDRLVIKEEQNARRARGTRPAGVVTEIKVDRHGYIDQFMEDELLKIARKHDLFIEFSVRPGSFLISGLTLAEVTGKIDDEIAEKIRNQVIISATRRPQGDVEFSLNLLVEIGLRALSPGINDTFTAIACVDRLSSALSAVVIHGLRDPTLHDEEGTPRLYLGDFNSEQLVDIGFNPLRRAARGNVLMASSIARALGRLLELAGEETRPVIEKHLKLLERETELSDVLDVDKNYVRSSFDDLRDAA
ncbi:MAG: DUF2254 domain-containing protein [Pseudomonadota bacterium]